MVSIYLDPKNEVSFKRLFGSEKNVNILVTLLNVVLIDKIKANIEFVKFLNPLHDPELDFYNDNTVSVLCKDKNNILYIIELVMQNETNSQVFEHLYMSNSFIKQMDIRDKYEFDGEIIFLTFTDFIIFPNKKSYKSDHVILNKQTLKNELNNLSLIFIDLEKFSNNLMTPLCSLSLEESFYYFLKNTPIMQEEEIQTLKSSHDIFKQAYEELNASNWDNEDLNKYIDK